MLWFSNFAAFVFRFFVTVVYEEKKESEGYSKAIKDTWKKSSLEICLNPSTNFAGNSQFSYRIQSGFDYVNIEVRNFEPLVIRLVGFIPPHLVQRFQKLHDNLELVDQTVDGGGKGDFVSDVRQAKGYWIDKSDMKVKELMQKFRSSFKFNPTSSESFLILSYDKNGHYAPHYDYLKYSKDSQDWWHLNYGNRLATALLIIKTAEEGGGTVFPKLGIVISPEPGDVILWFNANLAFEQENMSFHGACPIISGKKIAMSLWIRCKPHRDLICKDGDFGGAGSHQLEDIIRNLGY